MADPVHLPLPSDEPEPDPVPGCEVCADLAAQRAEAKAVDPSRVTDCSVEIRRHPHGRQE
jgi:hypothetical protein